MYLWIVIVFRGSISHLSVFGKGLSRKVIMWQFLRLLSTLQYSTRWNTLITPVAAAWSWTMSSIICYVPQVCTDVTASGIRGIFIRVPSLRHLSSSGSCPLYLSGLGNPTGSNTTAGLVLGVTRIHKPLRSSKVEIPLEGIGSWLLKIGNPRQGV